MVTAASPVSVLLVDDTPEIRRLLRLNLELDGRFEVVAEAGDGVAAVAAVEEHRPDVAVVDLAMPIMDGLEAIPLMRESSPGTRVVVLSAFGAHQMGEKAAAAGADRYLEKGMASDELVAAIAEVAGAGSARQPDDVSSLARVLEVLAHEVRSPLSTATGYVIPLRLALDAGDLEAAEQHLERIDRNLQRLQRLVGVILDARTVLAGSLELDPAPVKLAGVVREEVDDTLALSGRPWTFVTDEDAVAVVDEVRLRQVVTNLVANADKFSPPGERVDVIVRRTPDQAEIEVRDRGLGVPPDQRVRLFRRFGRLERDRGIAGTGLGLFLARELAVAHGGDLVHEQPEDGVGSRFVLRLPVAPADGAGAADEAD
jgi:signal transduction histidine kinase